MTISAEMYYLALGFLAGGFCGVIYLAVEDWRRHRKVRRQIERIDEARRRRYLLDYEQED